MPNISLADLREVERILSGFDLVFVDGQPWFLARAHNRDIDTLAAFGAEFEDMEDSHDREDDRSDWEPEDGV